MSLNFKIFVYGTIIVTLIAIAIFLFIPKEKKTHFIYSSSLNILHGKKISMQISHAAFQLSSARA